MNSEMACERIKLGRDLKALREADRMLWMASVIRSESKWAIVWNGRRAVVEIIAERLHYMGGMAGAW